MLMCSQHIAWNISSGNMVTMWLPGYDVVSFGCDPGYTFELELGFSSPNPCEHLSQRERWKAGGSGVDLADDFL